MDKAGHDEAADHALWDDWWTIWQSELAQLATDRELRELWVPALRLWQSLVAPSGRAGHDRTAGSAGADGAPRAAAAVAASDAGSVTIDLLSARVAELERRLAELDSPPRRDP